MALRTARLAHWAGARRPFLPGSRPIRRAFSAATTPLVTSELEHVLRKQDIVDNERIMFLPPRRYGSRNRTQSSRDSRIQRDFPDAVSWQAHLLPFYTMAYQFEVDNCLRHATTGEKLKRGHDNDQYRTSHGLTVAAVPDDHWAFGIALQEDPRFVVQDMASRPRFALFDKTADLVPSVNADFYFGEQDEAYLSKMYDPARAPLFAYAPPQLTRLEQQKVAEQQLTWTLIVERVDLDLPPFVEYIQLLRALTPRAFPHYRMVYKVQLKDGSLGFIDMSSKFHHSVFSFNPANRTPSVNPTDVSGGEELCSAFYRSPLPVEEGDSCFSTPASEQATRRLFDIVVGAMPRTPMTSESWEDPNLHSIDEMIFVLGDMLSEVAEGVSKEVQREPEVAVPVSDHLRRRAARPTPKPQPEEQKEKENQKEKEPEEPQRPPNRPNLTSRADERRSHLARRLRGAVDRQKDWQGAFGTTQKNARASARAAAAASQPATASPASMVVPVPLDPKGFYRLLLVKPRSDFIIEAKQDKVNQELKARYHQLSRKYHPDLAATPEEQIRMNKKMIEINVAYSEIERYETRLRYHRSQK